MNIDLHLAIKTSSLKQYQVAEKAGINPTDMSHIVNGKKEPSVEQKKSIADALKLKVGVLFK